MEQLPKYFFIKRDARNPLWVKYISWLNDYAKKNGYVGDAWEGAASAYYGVRLTIGPEHAGTGWRFKTKHFPKGTVELTLEQWDKIVNEKKFPLNTFVDKGHNLEVFNYLLKSGFPNPGNSAGYGTLYYYGVNEMGNIDYLSEPEIRRFGGILISYTNFKEDYLEIKETPKQMKNRKISASNAQRIINIACPSWKENLANKWSKDIVLGNEINVSEEFYQEMRKACTKSQHELFDEIFGKDVEIYPDGTPCLVRNYSRNTDCWQLRYADGKGGFYDVGRKSGESCTWPYHMKLDINNLPVNQ